MITLLKPSKVSTHSGFTLVEMAVVLVIVGLIIGGLTATLSAQVQQKNLNETKIALDNARQALLGYAAANGRFPCPALAPAPGITAVETFSGGNASNGRCATFFGGFIPSVTLGLTPTNTSGYLLDGWDNPIRYAIHNLSDDVSSTYIFTKTNGMRNANSVTCIPSCGMAWIANQTLLSICSDAVGIAGGACSGVATTLTSGAVIVVYSTGENTPTGGTGTDEAANLNADAAFVSHVPVATPGNQFDDVVDWISSSSAFGQLIQANQLP